MQRLLLLLALCIATLPVIAEDTMQGMQPSMQPPTPPPAPEKPKIRLSVEMEAAEIESLGMKMTNIQNDIMTQLIQSNIAIQDDPKNPMLLLRLKTIPAGQLYTTFIQLAFFEEAQLKRNRAIVSAMTWSQASLISTTKEDFQSEVNATINMMVSAFIKEYKRAMAK